MGFVDRQKLCHGLMGGRHLKSVAFVGGMTPRNHRQGGRRIGKKKYMYLGLAQRGYEAIPGGHRFYWVIQSNLHTPRSLAAPRRVPIVDQNAIGARNELS